MMSLSSKSRAQWRNIWCILRSLDCHEVEFSNPALQKDWVESEWEIFREHPHSFVVRCSDKVADAIWEAVERRM